MTQLSKRLSRTDRLAMRAVAYRWFAVVFVFGLSTLSGLNASWANSAEVKGAGQATHDESGKARAEKLRREWGIEVLSIRRSAAGYMLDFRYRVLDAAKAAPLLRYQIKPYITVAKSSATLAVPVPPKVGALRNSTDHPKAGRNYFALFANPGGHVKAGDEVTVVIGDFKAEHLTIE